jgi:dynein heavy chain 1
VDGTVSIAFIKKYSRLTSGQSLAGQLLLVKFPEGSPYETLHAYIRNALAPFFASAAGGPGHGQAASDGRKDRDRDRLGLTVVKRQLADLELALLNLKRDADIPEIRFPVDPRIEAYLAEARVAGKSPQVAEFGADDRVLNELQRRITDWFNNDYRKACPYVGSLSLMPGRHGDEHHILTHALSAGCGERA